MLDVQRRWEGVIPCGHRDGEIGSTVRADGRVCVMAGEDAKEIVGAVDPPRAAGVDGEQRRRGRRWQRWRRWRRRWQRGRRRRGRRLQRRLRRGQRQLRRRRWVQRWRWRRRSTVVLHANASSTVRARSRVNRIKVEVDAVIHIAAHGSPARAAGGHGYRSVTTT